MEESKPPCVPKRHLFFPPPERWDHKGLPDSDETKEAKSICRSCPQKVSCLDFAISMKERHGIWGGVNFGNEKERRRYVAIRVSKPRTKV